MQNYTLPLERPNKSAFFFAEFFCGTRTPFKSHGVEPHQNRAERHCPVPKTLLHAEQLTDDVCPRYPFTKNLQDDILIVHIFTSVHFETFRGQCTGIGHGNFEMQLLAINQQ